MRAKTSSPRSLCCDIVATKKWLLIALSFLFSYLSFSEAQAQIRIGAKGAFQLANMQFNTDALRSSNRVGFSIGPTVKIGLPLPGMAIDVAALYDQRDLKVQELTFRQKSILLQGDARCGVGIGDVLGIFFLAGPQFSFNVGDDIIHWFTNNGDSKQFSLQETMLSFNLGLGVTFANHLEGTITYNVPISKTADFTWHELSNHLFDETWNHAKTRTNAWNVSFTYYF